MEDEFNYINCVRLFADLSVFDNPKNSLSNEPICIRTGDCVQFDVILMNNASIADCTNIVSASFEIMDIGEINKALPRNCKTLLKKDVSETSINKNLTQIDVDSGKCHFNVHIASSESKFTSGDKFLKISAYTKNGDKITFTAGWIFIAENFESQLSNEPQQEINIASELQGQIYAQTERIDNVFESLSMVESDTKNLQNLKANKTEVFSKSETLQQLQSIQNIIDNNSLSISDLQHFKANTGALHFNGGSLALGSKQNVKEFCWCFRFKVNAENWSTLATKDKYMISNKFSAPSIGFGLRPIPGGSLAFQYCGSNGNKTIFTINASTMTNYTNDVWHSVVLCGFNNEVRIYFDGDLISSGSVILEDITPTLNFQVHSNGALIQYADIYQFNFDITSADAPYTISNYQQGKPIPPSLLTGNDIRYTLQANSTFMQRIEDSNFSLTQSEDGYITANADAVSGSNPYFWLPFGKTLKAGSNIEISLYTNRYSGFGYFGFSLGNSGSTTLVQSITRGNTMTYTLSADVNCIVLNGARDTALKEDILLSVKADGTLLALEDYTINGKVLDYSGNKNHATITGDVKGDNDSRVSAFVEAITTTTSEQN